MNWFHRLMNPHCEHCELVEERKKICQTCEILKMELEKAQRERDRLLGSIIDKPEIIPVEPPKIEPIKKISWAQRKAMLESESREAARIMQDKVHELETFTGVSDAPQQVLQGQGRESNVVNEG